MVELSSPPLGSRARCVVGDSQLLSAAPRLQGGWVRGAGPGEAECLPSLLCPWGSSRRRKQQGGCGLHTHTPSPGSGLAVPL